MTRFDSGSLDPAPGSGLASGGGPSPGSGDTDALDALLREWHEANASQARAGRDALMARLAREAQRPRITGIDVPAANDGELPVRALEHSMRIGRNGRRAIGGMLRSLMMSPYSRIAASLVVLVALVAMLMPMPRGRASACDIVQVPDGGRLEAFDARGDLLGPCPLRHTHVDVDIAGPFTRVTVAQRYHNRYDTKVEAVYTFPLSHRAAVDRMTMTIGDRVVVGEVKEREQARLVYEQARQAGYVASLLEQERPNIFTQSVANIEPGAEVVVEISYVETLESKDGEFSFVFPTVVGPRYIPGSPLASQVFVPEGLPPRSGLILRGPAVIERVLSELDVKAAIERSDPPVLRFGQTRVGPAPGLEDVLQRAAPVEPPPPGWREREENQKLLHARPGIDFVATYADGSSEFGQLAGDGLGHVAGRWFYVRLEWLDDAAAGGFSPDTNRVPDASRITPMPVRPPTRAGHDLSIDVQIDTGGPAVREMASPSHRIVFRNDDGGRGRASLSLLRQDEIPNKDFLLRWRPADDSIQEAALAHASRHEAIAAGGGFFTLIVAPPVRVVDAAACARELVFVLDTSGSMSGFPIEKSKEVMNRALAAMRPGDSFNVITFSGHTQVLWEAPRPATAENLEEARRLVNGLSGGGGTEMMAAINAALVQRPQVVEPVLSPRDLADLPADGRAVTVRAPSSEIIPLLQDGAAPGVVDIRVRPGLLIRAQVTKWTLHRGSFDPDSPDPVTIRGRWVTRDGERLLADAAADVATQGASAGRSPMRIALFLTDGYVGNDFEIVEAVKRNAGTTRVFAFGIGSSPNRYLLESMARAGRGAVDFVTLESAADDAVARFSRRVQTPVLSDIAIEFDGLEAGELYTAAGGRIEPGAVAGVPDLWDIAPLVIHGRFALERGGAAAERGGPARLTIRGRTGAGPYERTIAFDPRAAGADHDMIATLWARARVEALMNEDLNAVQENSVPPDRRAAIIRLGEQFQIMTQYTSFVAVEKSRLTIGGRPMLVAVPIELPEGTRWEGFFGGTDAGAEGKAVASDLEAGSMPLVQDHLALMTWSADELEGLGMMVTDGLASERRDAVMTLGPAGVAGRAAPGSRAPEAGPTMGTVFHSFGITEGDVYMIGRATERSLLTSPDAAVLRELVVLGDQSPVAPVIKGRRVGPSFEIPGSLDSDGSMVKDESVVAGQAGATTMAEELRIDAAAAQEAAGEAGGGTRGREAGQSGGAASEAVTGDAVRANPEVIDRTEPAGAPKEVGASAAGAATAPADRPEPEQSSAAVALAEAAAALAPSTPAAGPQSGAMPQINGREALIEELVIGIAALAREGKVDQAKQAAANLTAARPGAALAIAMRDAAADASLTPEQREARVEAVAKEAQAALDNRKWALLREARIRRVVDERLWPLVMAKEPDDAVDGRYDGPIPAGVELRGTGVLLTILVSDAGAPMQQRLGDQGVTIEATSRDMNLIVAIVPPTRIAKVAMLDGVRRIEPARLEPDRTRAAAASSAGR